MKDFKSKTYIVNKDVITNPSQISDVLINCVGVVVWKPFKWYNLVDVLYKRFYTYNKNK